MKRRVIPLWVVRPKLPAKNHLVLAKQLLVPGFKEPAHILRWGKSGLTICGQEASKVKDYTGNASHICNECWKISQYQKKPHHCARCAVEFQWHEEKTTLCEYCAHVAVSQYGANA